MTSRDSAQRVLLGSFPTPVENAPRLAAAVGLAPGRLWIKRDDLTGLGAGGNKVRKLERILAAARREGADTVVTTGAAQSNHARLTAAAAARMGLRAVLVLAGAPAAQPAGNLLLDELFGAQVRWVPDAEARTLSVVADETAAELTAAGRRAFVVPFGGSSPDGASAYADAAAELEGQLPGATSVVALGSGGTMAGLVATLGACRVLGVHVGAVPDPRAAVASLVSAISGPVDASRLRVRMDQVGAAYGVLARGAAAAVRLAARTEGIVLDPTYTGRALAGLMAAIRDGELADDEPIVFWHTGGLPGLFGHAQTTELVTGVAAS
ncbi:pyridoxal-phosphate dependent enzyme [Microbacterium sp. NPDC096154]|uniref:pyridoxal-phosphate dependent enzyme n=1 Tax=Microbacterium sp. NPDC096154 TaxID=3155549 RepID=UPI003321BDC8